MTWYDWIIIIVPVLFVLGMGVYSWGYYFLVVFLIVEVVEKTAKILLTHSMQAVMLLVVVQDTY